MVCQNNCDYSSYDLDNKYIKCECGKNKNMTTLDLKHLSKDNVLGSFLSTLKSTNYKVMRCYNLVFNFKIFIKNYGSIITLIFFIVYIVFMIYYCYKEINPLKVEISKLIFNEQKKEELEKYNKFSLKQIQSIKGKPKEKQKKSNLKKKGNNPPKKQKAKKITSFSTGEGIKKAEAEKIDVFGKSSRFDLKNKKTNLPVRPETSTKSERVNIKRNHSKKIKFMDNYDNRNSESDLNSSKDEDSKKDEDKRLDNFELNNLDYDEACEKDKRGFCKTYWSVLMREHVFLFTFIAGYDYNLFYIKIERFLTLICIEMTVNGLFFVHESMHRKYTEGEEFTFVQKIPQLLFTRIYFCTKNSSIIIHTNSYAFN